MEFFNHFEVSASYTTDTERGFIAREVETVDEPGEFVNLAPRLRPLIRGQVRYPSLQGAREGLDTALRTIRFIDAASVRESRAWVSIFGRSGFGPSGFDHTQVWNWFGHRLVTTEPYASGIDAAVDWCFEHGWQARRMPEWGMWNPPHTELILCAPPQRGADLDAICNQMRHYPPIPLESRQTDGLITVYPRPLRRAP